ncbi:MAG: hypothetical protein N3E48_04695 [Candidatus Bathyarchaeota archaeon]|nr:hypothetical protein [Candidatus Bathyarchaeota archaeon]
MERIGWIEKFVEKEISLKDVAESYIDVYKKIFNVKAGPGGLTEHEKMLYIGGLDSCYE